jgi:hypothetical protein
MGFKRKRPKSRRAGCLVCKPWKSERAKGADRIPIQERRSVIESYPLR